MSQNNKLYDVIVVRPGREVSYLERALTKKDAQKVLDDWLKIFNKDVYFEPVPKVKIVPYTG